jgi:hypothetical protein
VSVEIPKAVITFTNVAPPQSDIIELRVHLGCTKEVSSFDVLLQNWNKKYSPGGTSPIAVGDTGGIGISRGSVPPETVPILSHRVEKVEYESTPTENYIRVSGRCWGEKLFRKVVTKTYTNQKGEAIVKDLLDNYVGLSHVRNGTELVEDTDTTYTKLEYTDSPVWDILKYISESADKAGVIGYDFRVAPDGKFEFFAKNSKTSPVSLSEKIEQSNYSKDISRVRNKITVYGIADKSVPLDKDAWTEELTPADGVWTAVGTGAVVALDALNKARGQVSIKTNINEQIIGCGCLFTLNAGKEVNCHLYPTLAFWSVIENTFNGHGMLTLRDINGKMASRLISAGTTDWAETKVNVGELSEPDWFSVAAGFDWTQIKSVQIFYYFPTGTYSGTFWVDGLYFGGRRYSAIREDSVSQNAYGLRELTETDDELWSDNECDLRAKALLAYLKDPAENLTISSTIIDYGTTPLLASDKIHVTLPNENVDADFRIETVEYYVDAKTQTLQITLELGKIPPQFADYLYGLRAMTVTVEKLARTKLGKMVGLIGGGGGVGGGGVSPHHKGHEVGDNNGLLWPTPQDGGWDKITGWISPSHIGPYNDLATTLYFRTKDRGANGPVDHKFTPSDDQHGLLGVEAARWKEIYSLVMILYDYLSIKTVGEAYARAVLTNDRLKFGPGSTDSDVALYRKSAGIWKTDNKFECEHLGIGSGIYTSLVPDLSDTYYLGLGANRWKELYVAGAGFLGSLSINDVLVITAARVLQNVTTSADIITSGGVTEDVAVAKVGGGTRTMHFVNSKYTGYTDS